MLGATVPTIGGFHMGFKWGDEWGCECIQIYITLSRKWAVSDLSQDEIIKFKTAWQKSNIKEVVAHIPYLVNLASPDDLLRQKSIERLRIELSRADKFGVSLLVLHPGSYTTSTKEEGIERIVLGLDMLLKGYNGKVKILLETMTGQGTMIGSSFKEIAFILGRVKNQKSVKVCLDIGHLFMAGYDIRNYAGYKKTLTEFEKVISIDKIKAIHLNDSKNDLGSRKDRHADIGKGKMGMTVFKLLMRDQRFKDIPKILEIPNLETKAKPAIELLRNL